VNRRSYEIVEQLFGKDEAEAMYRRPLVIAEKQFGPQHPQVAVRLVNIAGVLIDHGKLKEAEAMLRQAISIEEQQLVKNDPARINTRMKLVQAIRLLGRVTDAEAYCPETLADAEIIHWRESASVGEVLHTLGTILVALNRAIKAKQTFWEALKVREKGPGEGSHRRRGQLERCPAAGAGARRLQEPGVDMPTCHPHQ
jgi:hypothetical protein